MSGELPVLIVADDALARAGLATLLADEPGITVAGRVSSLQDLAEAVRLHRPAVVLWDLGWSPQLSLERLGAASDALPPIAALLPDAVYAVDARLAGARGLLRREAEPQALAAALVALSENLLVVDPDLASALQSPAPGRGAQLWTSPEEPPLTEELTARELEVLRLLAEGLPNKTIAQRLDISEHTVKFHVNAILGKLGVVSRTEAVVRATRLGLILL
jgi:two-component system, NarL family, nitrate/nitrite response regulator NarL